MRLSGINIRKAIELEVPIRDIFKIVKSEEGDIAAKEIYEDKISHSSEIANIDEVFGKGYTQFFSEAKQEIKINENLTAYIYNFYLAALTAKKNKKKSKIESDKCLEIFFLNTKILNYSEFIQNIMDAHSFLGKFPKGDFKRRFSGIGSFNMEDYVANHYMSNLSDVHFMDFFIKDSNLVSSISNILTARYEKDIIEQREYFNEDEYYRMLDTVKRHKQIIASGFFRDEDEAF